MGVWLMDCQSEILHNLLACFFFLHHPPPPDLHNVQRSQQSSSCETLLTFEACIIHIFFFSFFPFSSWTGVHFLCVCVFYFVWFFFNFTFGACCVAHLFSNLHPHSLSNHLFRDERKKKPSFFFFSWVLHVRLSLQRKKKCEML